MARAAYVGHKVAKLVRFCQEHFVFVVDVLAQKGNQLGAGAVLAQCQRDGAQSADRVESSEGLVALEFITATQATNKKTSLPASLTQLDELM